MNGKYSEMAQLAVSFSLKRAKNCFKQKLFKEHILINDGQYS